MDASKRVDTSNRFAVGRQGHNIVILSLNPEIGRHVLTADEALNLAAWIRCIAFECDDLEFQREETQSNLFNVIKSPVALTEDPLFIIGGFSPRAERFILPVPQALNFAAWLKKLADPTGEKFNQVLEAIQNT